MAQEFLKLSKKKKEIKVIYLELTENTIYAKKSQKSKNYIGMLPLTIVKCEFLHTKDVKSIFPNI